MLNAFRPGATGRRGRRRRCPRVSPDRPSRRRRYRNGGHDEDRASRGLGRRHAHGRVLDGHTGARVDPEGRRGREVGVRRRLGMGRVLDGDVEANRSRPASQAPGRRRVAVTPSRSRWDVPARTRSSSSDSTPGRGTTSSATRAANTDRARGQAHPGRARPVPVPGTGGPRCDRRAAPGHPARRPRTGGVRAGRDLLDRVPPEPLGVDQCPVHVEEDGGRAPGRVSWLIGRVSEVGEWSKRIAVLHFWSVRRLRAGVHQAPDGPAGEGHGGARAERGGGGGGHVRIHLASVRQPHGQAGGGAEEARRRCGRSVVGRPSRRPLSGRTSTSTSRLRSRTPRSPEAPRGRAACGRGRAPPARRPRAVPGSGS